MGARLTLNVPRYIHSLWIITVSAGRAVPEAKRSPGDESLSESTVHGAHQSDWVSSFNAPCTVDHNIMLFQPVAGELASVVAAVRDRTLDLDSVSTMRYSSVLSKGRHREDPPRHQRRLVSRLPSQCYLHTFCSNHLPCASPSTMRKCWTRLIRTSNSVT